MTSSIWACCRCSKPMTNVTWGLTTSQLLAQVCWSVRCNIMDVQWEISALTCLTTFVWENTADTISVSLSHNRLSPSIMYTEPTVTAISLFSDSLKYCIMARFYEMEQCIQILLQATGRWWSVRAGWLPCLLFHTSPVWARQFLVFRNSVRSLF